MQTLVANFERELRSRTAVKSSPHLSEEAVLVRGFKYFDLTDQGRVNKRNFIQAVKGLGVVNFAEDDIARVFEYYDSSDSGHVNYKELAKTILDPNRKLPSRAPSQPSESSELSQSGKIRQIGRAREFPDHLQNPSQVDKRIDHILGNLRRDLLRQGLFSILRFAKHLKVTPGSDQIVSTMNHSRKINLKELSKTFRDMNIEINEADIRVLFEYLDRERKHQIVFDAVVELVKVPMSENRIRAVEELFARLDSEMKGYLTIDEFSHLYNTSHHPAVVGGKKTHKDITDELIESFADYLTVIGVQGRRIDIGEFVDYFTYLSPSISEDHIFETQLQEAWRPVRYFSKHTQQKPEEPVRLSSRQKVHPNANPSRPSPQSQDYFSGSSPWERLREQLLRRGMKTAISLRRQLFLMDDNEDLHINSWEFYKALKDFRLNLSESEVMNIYNGFIRQKTDELHIPTFMQAVLGQVSAHRNGLIAQTFSALDGQNQGHITLTILRQSYSARQHPDVVNGSKNDEEATEVFFELFDTFHNTAKGQRKEIVTRKEFTEFFSYLSPFVSEDRRFESILDCCVANTTIPNTNPIRNTAPHDNHVNHSSRLKRVQSSQTIHKKPFSDANDIITERNTTRFGVVAPFGVDRYNHYKTSYNTFHSNSQKQMVSSAGDKDRFAAGVTSWPGTHYVDPRKLDLELKYQQTLERMASALKARGVKGFLGLLESFKKADPRKTGLVDFGGFCKVCNETRLGQDVGDLKVIFEFFDRTKTGLAHFLDLMSALRGFMSEYRQSLVDQTYESLIHTTKREHLTVEEVVSLFSASSVGPLERPAATQIVSEFIDLIEKYHSLHATQKNNRVMSRENFLEFFDYLSAIIEADQDFSKILSKGWSKLRYLRN